jgi:DnaJ-class molecular chaperone
MEYRDYYKILGVPRGATAGEIKKAFRKLAREHHPDRNAGDKSAESRFKDINEANAVLGDPDKRKKYDTLGADWEALSRAGATAGGGAGGGPFGAGGPFGGFGGGNVRYEYRTSGEGEDLGGFSDFFRMVFGAGGPGGGTPSGAGRRTSSPSGGMAFDDVLSQMGIGQDGSRRPPAAPPKPVAEATAELDLTEAFRGTSRLVEVAGRRLEVAIPAGVDTGSRVKLTGKGPDGGDLVVHVRVRPHPIFSRRGADLERELPLTLEEALLGAEVPVETLKGRVVLTIPAATQNGRVFRLTGQGMPRLKGGGRGDLYLRTRVVLPVALDDEARAAAARLFELVHQPDPRATRS